MKRTRFIILFMVVAGLAGAGISLIGAEVVNRTGNDEFCGSCHGAYGGDISARCAWREQYERL